MKRILSLVVVLALASVVCANGNLNLQLSGLTGPGGTANVGDVIVIRVADTYNQTLLAVANPFTISVDAGTLNSFAWLVAPTTGGNNSVAAAGDGSTLTILGAGYIAKKTMETDGAFMTVRFTVPNVSAVHLSFTGNYGTVNSSALNRTIVVPEPMTMVLLGLGGLFLRRKAC